MSLSTRRAAPTTDKRVILAIVDHQRRRVPGFPTLAPSSGPPVHRPPHEQTIGKQFLQEPDDVVGDSFDRLVRSAFLVVGIEEVVVDDVANRKIGGVVGVGNPNLANLGMDAGKTAIGSGGSPSAKPAIRESVDEQRHENGADAHGGYDVTPRSRVVIAARDLDRDGATEQLRQSRVGEFAVVRGPSATMRPSRIRMTRSISGMISSM